jgi:micrococcal nuclease
MKPPYQYAAEAVRVVDGDTIDVILDFGFSLKQKMRLRLSSINTPELNSKDEEERERAEHARSFVWNCLEASPEAVEVSRTLIVRSRELVVKTIKTAAGKERQTFGRYVAEVYFKTNEGEWKNLNQLLLDEGLAVVSKG